MPSRATFWAEIGKKLGTLPQLLGKTDAVWRHVAIQDAAEPFNFNVLHMDPMNDDAVSNQLLGPHLCLAIPLFGLRWAKSLTPCLKCELPAKS